ncbi:hypothetical protein FF38_07038 [Lucilia cuprina]|uniref:C2H2-type domain-containing protein n=1 Tax=Lucilia cuprina TaxID=7375 RepID=A0A0L0CQJ4_LUCCU|nr:hypothetical protein FF38_07038 [Lucilia cuprina]
MDFINSNSNSMYSASEYKQQTGVRYHPYLHTPTSGIPSVNSQNSNSNNALDANVQTAPVVSSASSSVMSPRVVSSTSPSSSSQQMHISGSASSIGSLSAGNPSSPNSAGGTPQCKKCGIMCTNETELQEHIANVHGASPYGSSGYASSPYIKEEMQQQTPPSQTQQQPPSVGQQPASTQGGNPGEILDLDSQKMLYPPVPGSIPHMMQHQPLANTDPLHGLHSMQQRAGLNSWDQQSQEGLPPYLQQQQPPQTNTESKNLPQHSPYYQQSPKQSPYHVSNSSNSMKTEYHPLIKNEYSSDSQQYLSDKSFDPTQPQQQQQQQMMPPAVSSSPAEFPSTTTGGPQDNSQQMVNNSQQFRAGNFEPPSSSSTTISTGPLSGKAANWKSNEARRPKTYNCTACNKWFTSSGHLKRHYNTTLHKNAVKSSGQPDPATLPISAHHHPARDPSGKSSRRAAAAAAAQAANSQQQQQPPNPVQPPEPPNSPQDYGGSQVAAGGLTPLSHYAATPSPNSMYGQQQQYQHNQYMPQVQSTTSASPQHASPMTSGHHLQQQQHMNQQQQTVMNGHPNALAGPSVPTTQQTPMPSSQMRGLLNNTSSTTTTMHIIKNEHMEAATLEEEQQQQQQEQLQEEDPEEAERYITDPEEEVEELGYLTRVKEEALTETEQQQHNNMYSPKADMEELAEEQPLAAPVHREVDPNVAPLHNQLAPYHLEQQQQQPQQADMDMERLYHNTTPSSTHSSSNNMPVHSPLIISHQQYQEQLQQQQLPPHQMVAQDTYTLTQTPPPPLQQQQLPPHQMVAQDTYTLTQTPPPPLQQQQLPPHHSIMDQQPYINMPLAINTQQPPNSMLLQQQPDTTIPMPNTIPTTPTTMVNMLAPSHHHMPLPPQQHTELQPLVNMQQQPLDTNNTNTPHMLPSHITTSNITNMASYHQLQQPGSVLPPLDHTLTYPHTIIGNSLSNTDVLTLDAYGNLVTANGQQVIQTSDGQLLQLISSGPSGGTTLYSTQSYNPYMAQRSPQEGDLPPMTQHYQQEPTTTTLTVLPPSMSYSPSNGNSNCSEQEYKPSLTEDYINNNFQEEQQQQPQQQPLENRASPKETTTSTTSTTSTTTSNKRKRNPSTSSSIGANSTMLPSGRIKCLPCDKEFTKICYLTQHNKSFHSGEYPFRCQKCGKRYQSEDVYITHLGKHKTTDKAHKCDICPKQFHHKTDLRRHIEAIHTGNKQHSCDICEKSFCRKDHLRKHLETHNRPRLVAKKTNSRANNSITAAFAKVNKKSKDSNTTQIPLSSPSPLANAGNQNLNSLPSMAAQMNETNSLSSATTSTPSPLTHHIDDVAADDEDLLDDELDEYDNQELEDNEEYLTMAEYEQQIQQMQSVQGQYLMGNKQVYQMVEQELPMY